MYVVFVDELEGPQDPIHTAKTLEQAFAQIACRCVTCRPMSTPRPSSIRARLT